MSRLNVDVSQGLPLSSPPVSLTYRNRRVRYWTPAKLPRVMLPRWDGGYGATPAKSAIEPLPSNTRRKAVVRRKEGNPPASGLSFKFSLRRCRTVRLELWRFERAGR